jgi:hypothetical protein
MIGCVMLLPLAALLLAGIAVTGALVTAMGAFLGSMIAYSTAFITFMIIIFS